VVITTGDIANPTIVDNLLEWGAAITWSLEEEKRAMRIARYWFENHLNSPNSVSVFTDSHSLCTALVDNNLSLDTKRSRINSMAPRLTIQWIPGQCEIACNEEADNTAKRATKIPSPSHPISYVGACTQIRATTKPSSD
jgi:hypothetical protein